MAISDIKDLRDICIYDIEVFIHDWLVVIYDIDNKRYETFHNDSRDIRRWISERRPILCGFNNKHYDDYILLGILKGNTPEEVKLHNDFILEGNQGYEFSLISSMYKGDWFQSFDLRDDLPIELSLKAIEGNMEQNIVESSIDFTVDHKLSDEELAEVAIYCTNDVTATYDLFKLRAGYLNAKLKVAKTGDMDPVKALGLTNPKLSATFLGAIKLKEPTKDELIYKPPEALRLNKYKEVLEFYRVIDYDKTFKLQAKDIELVYGWGGIHGAIEHYSMKSTKKFKMVDIDVGSYYPSMIIQLGYTPTSIPSAQGYKDIYDQRIHAKHTGDSDTADALKLVLNSTYGALKNQYNPLYEPRIANHICISGQLLLTDLIEKLEDIPTLVVIQANTDGLMIGYDPCQELEVNKVVSEWEARTRLNMEYTEIKRIVQKDVNNYVLVAGGTYLIEKDGSRKVTKPDKDKISTKGAYVSLFNGGDFRNNSLVIVHKALVNYFIKDIPVEETINTAENIFEFQMIAKTGHTYKGTVYEYDGEKIPTQRVNRVYASSDEKRGTIYKLKDSGRLDKVANIPDHCFIDNVGNEIKLSDIDKNYYIDLAKKRIADYVGEKKEKRSKKTMAATKKAPAAEPENKIEDFSSWNIYKKLARAKVEFGEANIKKTGKNMYAEFTYFQLSDIIPVANRILDKYGLLFFTTFTKEEAKAILVNADAPDQYIGYTSPMRELNVISNAGKQKMNALQGLGAEETYQRRYLYMMMLDVVEDDTFDATSGKPVIPSGKKDSAPPATPEQRKEAVKTLTDQSGAATEVQKNSIKKGLQKLRDTGDDHEDFIAHTVAKMKSGTTSEEAEKIISEIGKRLYPEG